MARINIFWFRRDLRFEDNTALHYALNDGLPVLPIFIFDRHILDKLEDRSDARVQFIHDTLAAMNTELAKHGSGIKTFYGTPQEAYQALSKEHEIAAVYTNRDYEPYATERDQAIEQFLKEKGIGFYTFKDHVIFEKEEIVSGSGNFYKVFTPYSKAWRAKYEEARPTLLPSALQKSNWAPLANPQIHGLAEMNFEPSPIEIPPLDIDKELISKFNIFNIIIIC